MVRISPLLCFFGLFLASAASECGGQENCVGEKDAAVLLQGPIRMHDQGSALSQTSNLAELDQEEDQDMEEAAASTDFEEKEGGRTGKGWSWPRPSPSPRPAATSRRRENAYSAGCKAQSTKTACDNAGSNCEFIGETCMASCTTFTTEATCPLDFCYLRRKMIVYSSYTTYASKKSCISYASQMVFGGIPSQAQNSHMIREGKVVSRPEYMTAQHLSTGGTAWKACGGTTDCWSVTGERYFRGDLRSGFQSLAVEFAISCHIEGSIQLVKVANKEKNAKVKVWYNLNEQSVGWRGPNRWNRQEYYLTPKIYVKESDEEPILRIELWRLAAGQDAAWEARVGVGPVQRPFDACMDVKGTHGQCLKVFAGSNSELRTDHQMQLDCIDDNSKGTWSWKDKQLCSTWLTCLNKDSEDAIATIRKAIEAAAGLSVMQVQQNRTDLIPGSSGVCINPATLDIESFDCNCFDWMQDKSQEDIRCAFCTADKVCTAWANVNCNNCPTALVETASKEITMSQQSLGQKDSEDMATASLDESLSGKRC